ncbi:MAG: DUF3604 domain-containing protein [Geminicoccaceae bacterium]
MARARNIGTNSVRDYFLRPRFAFLDACVHQGNDFQMTQDFWQELNDITGELNQPGRFITVPGFEWSGNTALGGDRNVYYFSEGRPIRRLSHAMVLDRLISTATPRQPEFFAALAADDENAICFAHCGGRYADIKLFHDGRFERSVEVHSAWGTFEWPLHRRRLRQRVSCRDRLQQRRPQGPTGRLLCRSRGIRRYRRPHLLHHARTHPGGTVQLPASQEALWHDRIADASRCTDELRP